MLKVAILGTGFMGKTHAEAWKKIPDARIVAAQGRHRGRTPAFAEQYGGSPYYHLAELLDRERPDVVDVCLPTPQHRKATEETLAAGAHVLCEKPIALTLEDADAMIDAARRAAKVFMVAHVLRFWPEYEVTKQLLDSGELGEPVSFTAARINQSAPWAVDDWFSDPALSGGAVVDLHIHDLDFARWAFGDPTSLRTVGFTGRMGGWDHVLTEVLFRNGCIAVVQAANTMPVAFPFTMEFRLACTRAVVEMGNRIEPTMRVQREGRDFEPAEVPAEDGYARQIRYFHKCVREDTRPTVVTPEDARAALAMALAARESVERGGETVRPRL